jgi:hypothetical protein
MLSSGANVIIWGEMLSSGMKCYHLELMLSSGANVIIWDVMLSSRMKCYHLELMLSSGANVIIWDEMPPSGANVIVCIYCYHLVLSCDVIIWDDNTPLFIFPGNFTHSHYTRINLIRIRLDLIGSGLDLIHNCSTSSPLS